MDSAVEDFKNFNAQVRSHLQELKNAYDEISKMKDGLELLLNERTDQLKLINITEKSNEALLNSNKKLEQIQKERNFLLV